MPTPIGHALVGVAIAWSAEAIRRTPKGLPAPSILAVTCAGLAAVPDLDLLYRPLHRMMTHSVIAPVLAGVIAGAIMRIAHRRAAWQTGIVCGLAYASHLLLDWLGGDTKIPAGVQLLWPFSDRWFISSWEIFRPTDLGGFFTAPIIRSNAVAVLREVLFLGPIAIATFFWRRRKLAGRFGQSPASRSRHLLPPSTINESRPGGRSAT